MSYFPSVTDKYMHLKTNVEIFSEIKPHCTHQIKKDNQEKHKYQFYQGTNNTINKYHVLKSVVFMKQLRTKF